MINKIQRDCPDQEKGDYLIIDTGGNRKKLNRYMIDARIPAEDRDSIPLVTAGSEILWVVGGRMNTGCGITPDYEAGAADRIPG